MLTALVAAEQQVAEAVPAVVLGAEDLVAGFLAGRSPRTLRAYAADLEAWVAVRGPEPGPLFVNFDRAGKGGGRLSGRSVARVVAALGAEAGLGGVRPHGLRHAAITAALDATGGDVRTVQRYSRHAKLETVLLYDDSRRDAAGEVAQLVAAMA